ncbi:putative bifunctional diguanylate cyclase/phosphodiesterase [Paraconexibacter sp.]|uniref:putative bifunctional diguanylate cyclase/phosphodiesterase n=1 Tax=Paraconexibacter sp. TaxID=2949640 RepID=UPI0035691CE3
MPEPDRPRRVLLVEDDADDELITRHLLERAATMAFEVEAAQTYETGLEMARTGSYDVHLVDYRLGSRTGLDLVRELRGAPRSVPVILLTGINDYAVDLEATALGVADYLVKDGLTPDVLERSLRYSLHTAQALRALRESEERYALAVRGANDGVWDWSLPDRRVYLSGRWRAMLGLPGVEATESPEDWLGRVHPDDRLRLRAEIDAHLAGDTSHLEVEHRMRHADGTWRWMLTRGIAITDEQGEPQRLAGSLTDITARKQAEDRLVHDALHDALTSLPNRALFMDRLTRAIARSARRPEARCAIAFLDIDHFKVVNDGLGHTAGDHLLVAVARRLESGLRPGDTVARLGGDEFTVLLEDIDQGVDAEVAVARLLRTLNQPFVIEGRELVIGASAGIALSGPRVSAADLLRDADTAMYRAKSEGRARYAVFDHGMREQVIRRLDVETELRSALEHDRLAAHYQPILRAASGELVGFELLARWTNLEGQAVPPADFIPIAEETGLIGDIGRWALRSGCAQLRRWLDEKIVSPEVTISVNISGRHFNRGDLAGDVLAALEESGLEGRSLRLEITESVILDDPETVRSTLTQLGEIGVRAHIDDFGVGYSSLAFLHRFPGDTLKIDRSFVASMAGDPGSRDIVRAIAGLAATLGMRVIAEGVETAWDLELVRAAGCELAQGFYLARPMPAADAAAFSRSIANAAPAS